MRRRDFIALAGSTALSLPFAATAQKPAKPVVGFVHGSSPGYFARFKSSFDAGLKEEGYVADQDIRIEYRWAEGHYERLPALIADLLGQNVNVIFAAGGTDPAKVAKAATNSTPIVFVSAADPVKAGLVESLNRPGGNITGVSLLASALESKKLELLREAVPKASSVGLLINPDYPDARLQSEQFLNAARQLSVNALVLSAHTEADIATAFDALARQQPAAMVVGNDPFFGAHRAQLVALAARYAMPLMHWQREFVDDGGLISYGPQFSDGYRQGGVYVGRVLKGEMPADLPIVQPTKFEMVINLKSAKALGLTIPVALLAVADEVIE